MVFLDVSKAFDTVNHNLLLSKLQSLGLDSSAIAWFHSYLQDRSMTMCLEECRSSPGFPSAGVPQGSILGPSLFSTVINDFPQTIPSSTTVLYADDTTIYVSGTDVEEISSVLLSCLNAACLWMQANCLKLSTTKSKCMLIHSSSSRTRNLPPLDYLYLALELNKSLLSSFLVSLSTILSRGLTILITFHRRSLVVFVFYNAYLGFFLIPCWFFLLNLTSCTKKEAQQMETLLNYACRVVLHHRKHESATAARSELGMTTLAVRRKIHLAHLMYKCTHSQHPPYLASLFLLPSSHPSPTLYSVVFHC